MIRCKTRFASASLDKTICIWKISYREVVDKDTKSITDRKIFEGCELEKIIDPNFRVMALNSFINKKNWIAFGGALNRVIVWDIDNARMVKEFECENNNLTDIVIVEDEGGVKNLVLGICENDDVVRGWCSNYDEEDEL